MSDPTPEFHEIIDKYAETDLVTLINLKVYELGTKCTNFRDKVYELFWVRD